MGAVTMGPDGNDKDDLLIVDDRADPTAHTDRRTVSTVAPPAG